LRGTPLRLDQHPLMTFATIAPAFRFLAAAFAFASAAAHAAPILPAYPTVDPGPSTTAWFTDRYPPSAFDNVGALSGRNDVLAIVLSSADGAASRPPAYASAFYNTQGRKIDVGLPPSASWIASVYIPASWTTTNPLDSALNRRTDLWATLKDGANAPTYYPIVGFTNADATTGFGGTPRFRVFDGTGNWNDLATPVAFDAWNDIGVTFTGTTLEYRINGARLHRQPRGHRARDAGRRRDAAGVQLGQRLHRELVPARRGPGDRCAAPRAVRAAGSVGSRARRAARPRPVRDGHRARRAAPSPSPLTVPRRIVRWRRRTSPLRTPTRRSRRTSSSTRSTRSACAATAG
jgi:hypothetical protein